MLYHPEQLAFINPQWHKPQHKRCEYCDRSNVLKHLTFAFLNTYWYYSFGCDWMRFSYTRGRSLWWGHIVWCRSILLTSHPLIAIGCVGLIWYETNNKYFTSSFSAAWSLRDQHLYAIAMGSQSSLGTIGATSDDCWQHCPALCPTQQAHQGHAEYWFCF